MHIGVLACGRVNDKFKRFSMFIEQVPTEIKCVCERFTAVVPF